MGTKDSPHIHALGTMTVFYIPSHKLDDPRFYHGNPDRAIDAARVSDASFSSPTRKLRLR